MSSNTGTNKKQKVSFFHFDEGFFDYQILFISVVLVLFGIMMIYSASSYRAVMEGNPDYFYAKKQALIAVGSMVVMFVASGVNYKKYYYFAVYIIAAAIFLCACVFVLGIASHGAVRWINLGFVKLQPSELLKPAIAVYIAKVCSSHAKWLNDFKSLSKLMILPIIGIGIVATENLSTAIVCFMIIVVVVFVAADNVRPIIAWFLLAVVAGVVLISAEGYRGGRIDAWLNPETSENGYQTMQSLYAIGSGGLFGKGLGNSIQKTGFLPESHNDMIFSIICEELGLFGGLGIIALFVMLLFRIKYIANNAPNKFASYMVIGVLAQIAVQLIINVGVVTNTLPPTGVTLPFVSYGGSSILAMMIEIGLVLSVSRQLTPYE